MPSRSVDTRSRQQTPPALAQAPPEEASKAEVSCGTAAPCNMTKLECASLKGVTAAMSEQTAFEILVRGRATPFHAASASATHGAEIQNYSKPSHIFSWSVRKL
eukprot:4168238-Pleurochrysis_carterae.AAC.2